MKKIILTLTITLSLMFPVTVLADGNFLLEGCLVSERMDKPETVKKEGTMCV